MSDNYVYNLDNVDEKANDFTALNPGWYECIVTDTQLQTSQTGSPMIKWTFTGMEDSCAKRKFFNYTLLNKDFGLSQLKKTILATGVNVDMSNFNALEFVENGEVVGMPIRVKVGVQMYDGEKRNNVKDVEQSKTCAEGYGF